MNKVLPKVSAVIIAVIIITGVVSVFMVKSGFWASPTIIGLLPTDNLTAAITNYTLTVNSAGATAVAIVGAPTTYSGTTNYTKTVADGTTLTLTAPASKNYYYFVSWTGCNSVSGTGNRTCNVTMTGSRTVTANYTLNFTVNSTGATAVAIVGDPVGFGGTTNYAKTVFGGTTLTLTAPVAKDSAVFLSWSSCDSISGTGNRTCNVTMSGVRIVTANYTVPTITIKSTFATSVAIVGAPTTYSGTTNYTKTVSSGESIALTAPATSGGGAFLSWTGCNSVSGTGNQTCNLVYTAVPSRTVTANYIPILTVNSTGATAIAIVGAPTTLSGTTNYTKNIADGTTLTLTAPGNKGYALFSSWTGCNSVSGTGNRVCNLTMSGSRVVSANYIPGLTVNSTGATAIVIVGDPTTYSGTTNYGKTIANGTVLILTAATSNKAFAFFSSWTGCNSVSGTGNRVCSVTMSGSRVVTANYTTPSYTLTVNSTGATSVAIVGSSTTYSGTTNYTKTVVNGTTLTLTAPATSGSASFLSWSSCDSVSGTGNRTCSVQMTGSERVTVNYN